LFYVLQFITGETLVKYVAVERVGRWCNQVVCGVMVFHVFVVRFWDGLTCVCVWRTEM